MTEESTAVERPLGAQVRIGLSRDLRFLDITMIGIGAMVGAGIFVLVGSAANVAGPAAVLAFGINGVVTLLTAFTYAELGSAYPEAGGGYLWAKEGLPPPAGFLGGWLSWIAHAIACSLYAVGFASFVHFILREYGLSTALVPMEVTIGTLTFSPLDKTIIVAIVLFFVWVNYAGVRSTGRAETSITLGKIAVLAVFIAVGVSAILHDPTAPDRFLQDFVPGETGLGGILLAMGLTFIAFEGYEIIAQSGEEVKRPRRNIPRAIFLSIAVVVVVYVLTFIVALGVVQCPDQPTAWRCLGGESNPELAMIRAAGSLLGPWGIVLMVGGGLLATTSALNATVYSSSRVSFAMGRDGALPRVLGRVHPKRHTPGGAVLISGLVILLIALTLPIEEIAVSAGILFLLLFVIANMSLLTLRRKRPDLKRGFRVPLVPLVPILAIAVNLFLAIYVWNFPGRQLGDLGPGQVAWFLAVLLLSIGLAYHYFKGGRQEVEMAPRMKREILEVIATGSRRARKAGGRVLVPLRDPENLALVKLGSQVAKDRRAELLILHVIEVPLATPPKSIRFSFVDERIRSLHGARELARKMGVYASVIVKIGHRVYDTILETIHEEGVEALILAWRGERPARGGRTLGTNIDFLVHRAKCDVVVFKGVGIKDRLERITVLSGHTWHVTDAAKIAALLAREANAEVTILTVVTQKSVEESTIADGHRLMEDLEALDVRIRHKIAFSSSIVKASLKQASDSDLFVMGASPKWALRKYDFGPLEDRIAKSLSVPVLMFRRSREKPRLER